MFQGVVDAHPDLFTAMWWDAVSQQFVFSGSERTAMDAAVAASVPKDASYRIEIVARPLADLKELQARLTVAVNDAKVASSSGIRVDGRVEIYLAIREEASVRAVTELAGADVDAVCVSGGADPATVARDGPQTTTGDGWRLLAAARDHPGRTPIEIATTQADYVAMWTHLAFDGGPPAVNLRTEVVLAIVAGESGSCPNRLDSVVFDRAAHLVRPNIVVPRGDRACTADARQRVYVIALQRDHLPDAPFQISARRGECSAGCDGDPITVDPS